MGYKSPIHPLELSEFQGENGEDPLIVRVVSPSAREGGDLNAGRRTIVEKDGTEREENSAEYMLRAMAYLAPKIRYWNLEDDEGRPIPLPRDLTWVEELDQDERAKRMVAHLMDQDENVVLAIYHEWRLVGMPKKADTPEGKDSETTSTGGPGASPRTEQPQEWDVRELERQIPM
jgi:hypothetical protein